MAEWRYLRGWSDEELDEALTHNRQLPLNFDPQSEMTPRTGWNVIHSRAVISREAQGPPGDAYERLWLALQLFHHSDPRIVVAHFREELPLDRRRPMLELRAMGLRFLCPVAIGATRDESGERSTCRGFCLDTLDGHIERGREWFLLEKDHETGEIRFRIEAIWREGDFPALWSEIGFELVGRRYQRAWHRLAHLRLRRIAAGLDPAESVAQEEMRHAGPPIPTEPVQFFGQRGIGKRGLGVEWEQEEWLRDRLWRALGLGALAGLRSTGAPAALARELERAGKPVHWRGEPVRAARLLSLLAAGEVIADKLPWTPPRTQPASLAARMASGAIAGSLATPEGEERLGPALVGAAAAAAGTFGAYHLRRLAQARSAALGHAVAVAEDALVAWAGTRIGRAAARHV